MTEMPDLRAVPNHDAFVDDGTSMGEERHRHPCRPQAGQPADFRLRRLNYRQIGLAATAKCQQGRGAI